MDEDAEILAVHAKFAADVVSFLFIEEDGTKEFAITRGQRLEDLAYPLGRLLRYE
jgi:hypothetical protein